MYIRTTTRKNKDGSEVRYVQLAHNEWDSKAGYSKVNVIYNFGREENVDKEGLKRLVNSISRFLSPEDALKAQAQAGSGTDIKFISSRPMGGAWFLHGLWQSLGIDKVLNKLCQQREFKHSVERAIFAMVANRARPLKANWLLKIGWPVTYIYPNYRKYRCRTSTGPWTFF